jgi:hypothetical protein
VARARQHEPAAGEGNALETEAELTQIRPMKRSAKRRLELGQYIVSDPAICHGQPTFKGTRIMVWQVLEDVAEGRSWDFICGTRWGGRIPLAAVAEAVRLAGEAWLEPYGRPVRCPQPRTPALAIA